MEKVAINKRIGSFLLMLCLALALFAGLALANPVAAQAGVTGFTTNINVTDLVHEGEPMTLAFNFTCDGDATPQTMTFWLRQNGTGVQVGSVTQSFAASGSRFFTFAAPAAGSYDSFGYATVPVVNGDPNQINWSQLPITVLPAREPDPSLDDGGAARDAASQAYYDRHFNYWLPIFTQLNEKSNSGSITVDTYGEGIDYIPHFAFDALVGTSRTLTVRHNGELYVIRGAAESADGRMRGILLGHNHSFELLGKFKA